MKKRRSNKEIMLLILFTALVCLGVMHFTTLVTMLQKFVGMLKPFIIGAGIAFVVNLPLTFLEGKLLCRLPAKAKRMTRPLGICLSFIIIILVVFLVILTVIPQLGRTITQLGLKIPVFFENMWKNLEILVEDYPGILSYVDMLENQSFNWNSILSNTANFLKSGVGSLLNSTVTVAGSLVNGVVSGLIALIFSIYILSQKEKLKSQLERLLHAYCKESVEQKVLYVSGLLYRNFSKFITGQCLEAVILGLLFVVVMTIFGMPYALMIGVLIAFTALIPIVGAFIGCFVGAFLILVENPAQALGFIILFLIIQQLEGNLIYPKVVGNSVGLPSIWVLLAVSLGSSMFGVIGMLLFIPLFATIYTLIREDVNRRQMKKSLDRKGDRP